MTVSGFAATFLLACAGGVLAELLRWYKLREAAELPEYVRSPFYWTLTALMVLAGGFLAVLYGTDPKNTILVVQIGLSAPLLLRVLADQSLPLEGGRSDRPRVPGYGFDPSPSAHRWLQTRRFLAGR
jgi:hypothetical protein